MPEGTVDTNCHVEMTFCSWDGKGIQDTELRCHMTGHLSRLLSRDSASCFRIVHCRCVCVWCACECVVCMNVCVVCVHVYMFYVVCMNVCGVYVLYVVCVYVERVCGV